MSDVDGGMAIWKGCFFFSFFGILDGYNKLYRYTVIVIPLWHGDGIQGSPV